MRHRVEHLTTKNSTLAHTAVILLNQGKILRTWTRDCNIYIKSLEIAGTHIIQNENDFEHLYFHCIVCMVHVCISMMFILVFCFMYS